jgi:hypothetical protein
MEGFVVRKIVVALAMMGFERSKGRSLVATLPALHAIAIEMISAASTALRS